MAEPVQDIPVEKVLEAYGAAPAVVKETFDAEATLAIVLNLLKKYPALEELLGREVGYLILDLITLTQFRSHLLQTGLDEKAAGDVIDTVTKEVLIPMKNPKEEKVPAALPPKPVVLKRSAPPVVELKPAAPQPPRIPPTLQALAAKPAAPATPVQPPKPAPPTATPKPPAPSPSAQAPLAAPPARPRVTIAPHPMRTMEQDAARAKGAPAPTPPAPVTPPPRPPVWERTPPPPVPKPAEKSENATALANTLKKYGVDPYREPIE